MKTLLKSLSLVLTVCIVFTLFSVCAATITVSAATVIEIDTADELRLIGRDDAYPLSSNYVLTADIDLADEEWLPIGIATWESTTVSYFTGTFDGQGHIISNMWSEDRSNPKAPVFRDMLINEWGFIACASSNAVVKNLAFKDVYFNLGYTTKNTDNFIGTVVGYIGRGGSKVTIENVAVLSGEIIALNFRHKLWVGGIATGFDSVSGTTGNRIKNCYNNANITAKSGSYSRYSSFVVAAGILAVWSSDAKDSSYNIVENCFNKGTISVSTHVTSNYTYLNCGSNIIGRTGVKANNVTTAVTPINNWAIDNRLVFNNSNNINCDQLVKDAETTNVVYAVDAHKPSSYEGLTSVTDSENNAVWTAVDGYYPMLATFVDYAEEVTQVNYTLIETVDELALIGNDDAYPLSGYYKLANNIDASASEWMPIGADTTFSGLFEGNGYTISGISIGKAGATARTTASFGFFSTLSGTVRNLKLTDLYFNTYASGGNSYLGGIAGTVKVGSNILSCHIQGDIIDIISKNTKVGGIIGVNTGFCKIDNCFADVNITAGYSSAISGGSLGTAGIVGSLEKASNVANCISIGEINAKYPGYVGAIVSHYYGLELLSVPENCYSNAKIDYYATANMKAFHSHDDEYTLVSKYEMLSGAMAGLLPADAWTDNATDLIPYLNVFAVPAVSTQTEEEAANAVEDAIRASVLTNYITEADIIAIAENCLEKGSHGFAISEFVLTNAINSTEGNIELTFTVGAATRSITLSISPIPEFEYGFSTEFKGRADGTVTITDADYLGKNYRLYWGDDNGKLAGYDAIATLEDFTVTDEESGVLVYNTIMNTLIPETATKLYLAVDNNIVTEFDVPEWRSLENVEPDYITAHVSDTHLGYSRSKDALTKVFEKMKEMGGVFITNGGDITNDGNEGQYIDYANTHTAEFSDITFWATLGNHDIITITSSVGLTAQQKLSYAKKYMEGFANPDHTLGEEYIVTVPDESEEDVHTVDYSRNADLTINEIETDEYILQMDYTMSYGEDMYVFMSAGDLTNNGAHCDNDVSLSEKQLAWLEKVLDNYYNVEKKTGQTYFIFHYATLENGLGGATVDNLGNYINYAESSAKLYEILDKYPIIHISGHMHTPFRSDKNIYVGTKHTAIQTPSNTKGHPAFEGYIIEHYTDYTLLKGYNFLTEEFIPNAMFYVAEEYNEIDAVAYYKVDGEKQGSITGITVSDTYVTDNKFIRSARKIERNSTEAAFTEDTYIIPYSTALSTADNQTFNQLYTFLTTPGAELRVFVKNTADYEVSFKLGLYGEITYNGNSVVCNEAVSNEYITIPASSGWVEIRVAAEELNISDENLERFIKGETTGSYLGMSINPDPDAFLANSGDALYVSSLEVFNRNIIEEITTDFEYYEQVVTAKEEYDTSTNKAYITKTKTTTGSELPFFNKTLTFTANADNFDVSAVAGKQNGFIKASAVATDVFKEWAIYNTSAEMRFWVKTDKDVTFKIGLYLPNPNGGEITSTINCTASDDWQEIRLKRSDFANSSYFNRKFNTATESTLFIKMYITNTFEAGQSISFGNRVEFFTHEAYDKGDANMDGSVDVRDLVKVKKSIANGDEESITADIDSDGRLAIIDLAYIRKWLLKDSWS